MDLPAGCSAVGPRGHPTSPGGLGHRTVGTPGPMRHLVPQTTPGKEPGRGGRAGCGRVAALGLVLAPALCPWPWSCSVSQAQRRRSVWAAGPASAVRVWDASHLTDALERVLGGPCRPIKATEIGKGLFIPLPLFSAASLIKSRSPWGKGGRSSPRAPAQQALRPAGLPEADSAAQKEGLSLSGLSPQRGRLGGSRGARSPGYRSLAGHQSLLHPGGPGQSGCLRQARGGSPPAPAVRREGVQMAAWHRPPGVSREAQGPRHLPARGLEGHLPRTGSLRTQESPPGSGCSPWGHLSRKGPWFAHSPGVYSFDPEPGGTTAKPD